MQGDSGHRFGFDSRRFHTRPASVLVSADSAPSLADRVNDTMSAGPRERPAATPRCVKRGF